MASTSTRPEYASTSSSSLPPQFLYDVYLSFRGEDTRKSFADHLYSALDRHGFSTFGDDDTLVGGEEIGTKLLNSIERSRISVIIFSRNYAYSTWCLDELVKIMECKRTFQQIVLPVFYDVDPSDLRAQRGTFAVEAFANRKERYGIEAKLQNWRDALTEAANLSGYDLRTMADGHEPEIVEKIVEDISKKLNLQFLHVGDCLVGIDSRVQRVYELLELQSDDVRMIGICGIGGIGKTTIAKAIYDQIHLQFEGSTFLADVTEISKRPNGLVSLQRQLLSDLLNEDRIIRNVYQGIEFIKQRLRRRKVLVVIDDVDNLEQLIALDTRHDRFHSGSRIIVTTRDEYLLRLLEVDTIYMPELLNRTECLQLFSCHAFRRDHPREDYKEPSRKVVRYAGFLPLVLKVLGSFLFNKTIPEWESALEKLKLIPHGDIFKKLKISFVSLSVEEKELFLDIACFFVQMNQNYGSIMLQCCDFISKTDLSVLSDRCLVTIEHGLPMMHDMLRVMGREIIRREDVMPGNHSRLWCEEDALYVLKNNTGTERVETLVLDLPQQNNVRVYAQAFANMKRLRLLQLNNVRLIGSYEHLSKELIWLCWSGFPLKYMPSNFFLEKVTVLDMSYSCLKHVWKGVKILSNLKFLNLSHSHDLVETPDFSGVTNLEVLLLNDCISLVEVHKSIECLDKLVFLELDRCRNLKKLPGIWKLTSLQGLSLYGCSKAVELRIFPFWASLVRNPDSISHPLASAQGLVPLTWLEMANCNFSYVPDEIGNLIKLKFLVLDGNKHLRELPLGIWNLTSLISLSLIGCSKFEKFSGFKGSSVKSPFSSAKGLISLKGLYVRDSNLLYIPDELESSISLERLEITGNKNLRELPPSISKLTSLRSLLLFGYSRYKKVPILEESQSISPLSICLTEASPMGNLDSISLSSASMQGLISLYSLDLSYRNLSHLSDELGSLISLKKLFLKGNNFCTLPASINRLSGLWSLDLSDCTRLQSLPELPVNLFALNAKNCTSLESISFRSDFRSQPFLSFSCCHSLKIESSFLQDKELSAVGEFSIVFPGVEVPDHFNYQNEGSVLSFVVSLLPDRKIRGWVLCAVIAGLKDGEAHEYEVCWGWPLEYKVENKTKGLKTGYRLLSVDDPPYRGDHLWLHYVPQPRENLQMEDGDEVEYSVHGIPEIGHPDFQLKNCGVNLIYEVDNQKDYRPIQYNAGRECARMATCLAAR